jgi:hypothetical protein
MKNIHNTSFLHFFDNFLSNINKSRCVGGENVELVYLYSQHFVEKLVSRNCDKIIMISLSLTGVRVFQGIFNEVF